MYVCTLCKTGLMKTGITLFFPVLIIIIFLTGNCAKQAVPTGGPRDSIPPEIVKSSPANGSTNFRSKEIEITFNEYAVLDKLNEKFMISPPTNTKPRIYLRGRNMFIEFQEALKDSTTYTLYFQDAIRDLNENNPLMNYQYVFSTGRVIDSLSVTGNVINAENLEPGQNILVLLHRELADSAPRKMLPEYLTMADKYGNFRINNLREGKYRLYALADNNNNKKYDGPDEAFAFYDSILNVNAIENYRPKKRDTLSVSRIDTSLKSTKVPEGRYKLFLFNAAKKARYLSSSGRNLPYKLSFILSLPPDTMKFDFNVAGSEDSPWLIEKNRAGDTITVWISDSTVYSSQQIKTIVRYPFTDSIGNPVSKTDTISLRYIAPKLPRNRKPEKQFKYTNNISRMGLKPGQQIIFSSETPFLPPDTSRIRFYEIEGSERTPVNYEFTDDSTSYTRYFFKPGIALKEGGKYLVIMDSSAFSDIYGNTSDSTGISFTVRQANTFGHLTMDIQNCSCPLIIQLLDQKEKFVAERKLTEDGLADFPFLEKGIYRIRAIYDLNNDGKWTTGDFDRKLQPEPVSYFSKEMEIKINWEYTEIWDVSTQHLKDQQLILMKETTRK
jgi:uncharacterized protein (DUF2141 family)